MPLNFHIMTPAEQHEQNFKALGDSVNLVNKLVTIESLSDEEKDDISRNVEHLELMLAKEELAADTRDKTSFTGAIAAGKAKLA